MGALADFLVARRDELVARFKDRVSGSLAPGSLSESELRNHLPDFLEDLSLALRESTWTPSARVLSHSVTAEQHGRQRLSVGPAQEPVEVRIHGGRDAVTLQVHNRGAPIPPEARPTLFLPFRRGEKASAMASEGMGLGLYIVREVVKAHEGTSTIESTEEEGTTFCVLLPRRLLGSRQGRGEQLGMTETGVDAAPH